MMGHQGELYRIHDETLTVVSIDDGEFRRQEKVPPLNDLGVRCHILSDGSLLALTGQQASRLEGDQWLPYPPITNYEHKLVNVIQETEPGIIWASVIGGLERWTDEGVTYFGATEGIDPSDDIHAICRAQSGDIWFGSSGSGVYSYDGHQFQQFTKANGLYSNTVRTVTEADDGTIWVAYRGSGVSAYRSGRWVHFSLESGLPNVPVLGFAEPAPGEWWLFTNNDALYRYNPDLLPPDTKIVLGSHDVGAHGVGVFSFGGRDAWNQGSNLLYSWRIVSREPNSEMAAPWSTFSQETTVATPPLSSGHYRLEVRSSDENGNVDPVPAVHFFGVEPPLWQKPIFFVPLFCSILLAAIAVIARNRSHRALRSSEAQLKTHRDNLEELVLARTHDLELAQEELLRKERLATLGELTATVSHELRNPLGTIQSSIYMIEKRVAGKGLGVENAIERTVRSVKRCDHIVEEMLDYTRTQAIETQAVNWDSWLRDALIENEVGHAISLRSDLDSGAVVQVDPELMRRVLINLLDNAVEAMETPTGREKAIHVITAIAGDRVMTYVEDTGPGIPEEALDQILEPLFSTKNFGVGLGTNIVKNIMERHGGGVEYGNVPNSGARVTIWLPTVSTDGAASKASR